MLTFGEPVSPVPAKVRRSCWWVRPAAEAQGAKVRGVFGLFKLESEEWGVDPRSPISNFLCKPLNA